MKACTVRFITRANGMTSTETASGFFERTETGASLVYRISQDEAHLQFVRGVLFFERRGETPLKARFISGKDSAMTVWVGDKTGEIPIHTDRLRIEERDADICISLGYTMLGAVSGRILLKIFISFSEAL